MCSIWRRDVDEALAQALHANRPALMMFFADWNQAGTQMRRETLENPEVLTQIADEFMLIQVDATDDEDPDTKALLERYGVVGLPTLIIFNGAGVEALRFEQYVSTPDLLSHARGVLEGTEP